MDWIILTSADMEDALNKPQLEILKAEILRTPSRDVASEVLSSIVTRIRAEIAAGEINVLDADHSRIPPELRESALRLAVEALQLRVPNMELTASQQKHADLARDTVLRVAKGELPVTRPSVGIRASVHKRGVYSGAAEKKATRKTLKGL